MARLERVWRASHRLDAETAPAAVWVGQRIPGEQHHVWVGLVEPERCGARVGEQFDTCNAVAVADEVGVSSVELDRPDQTRRLEVVFRVGDGLFSGRDTPVLSGKPDPAGCAKSRGVDGRRAGSEVGVGTSAVRSGCRADVGCGGVDVKAVVGERVADFQIKREGVAGLGVQPVSHRDPVCCTIGWSPVRPPCQAVDRVVLVGFGERELMVAAGEVVATVA